MQLLEEILTGIRSAVPPEDMLADYKLEAGDTVVGVLPDELKRVYAHSQLLEKQLQEVADDLNRQYRELCATSAENPEGHKALAEARKSLNRQYQAVLMKTRLVQEILSVGVGLAFPDFFDKELELRADWQVVIPGATGDRCTVCPSRDRCPVGSSRTPRRLLVSMLHM